MCSVYYTINQIDFACAWPTVFKCANCGAELCLDHASMCDECDSILCMDCEPTHSLIEKVGKLLAADGSDA